MSVQRKRAGFYFDGLNVYHAIADLCENHLKWLSYKILAERLVDRTERVEFVKVFSTYAEHLPASASRHRVYTAALNAEGVECIMGQFKRKTIRCGICRKQYVGHEEKESDVAIGVHLLNDCYLDRLDVAYIVTTDSDLAPAVRTVRSAHPRIELVTVSTPGRSHCFEVAAFGQRKATVRAKLIRTCLLPRFVKDSMGNVVATRPPEYDPPTTQSPL
jgi:uncharacterized LabA/DUF88 family protein